jgi:hypothetical protein
MTRARLPMLKPAGTGGRDAPVDRAVLLAEAELASHADQWQVVEHLLRPLARSGDAVALAATLTALLHDDDRYLDALVRLDDAASCGNGLAAHELAGLHGLLCDPECAERYRRTATAAGWVQPRPPVLTPAAAQSLARAWFEEPQPTWACDEVRRLVEAEPANALVALDALIDAAPDSDRLGYVGAGPLEDLARNFGDQVVTELERRAADPRWREALSTVWLEDADGEVTTRLEAIGCTQLRNR